MSRRLAALIVLGCLLAPPAAGQTTLAPQAGVIVLRNGSVIDGEVLRAGDDYVVTRGEGSELRLRAADVECFASSLLAAYDFKAARLSGLGARPHVELAKWCLRQGLHAKCSEQLTAATRAEPGHPQIKELETALALAVETPPPPSAPVRQAGAVTADELEKRLRALPKGSVEKFGAIVQPILLNRCGANRCHGPNAESSFRLLRPPPGQTASRRFTQRNLYETLKHLDAANPEASPLVTMPQQRHGNSLAAVFDKHSEQQLAELIAWVRLTVAPPPAQAASTLPSTISASGGTLSQPAAGPPGENPPQAAPEAEVSGPQGVRVMRPPLDQSGAAAPPSSREPPIRDPFDAEIFNRRFHAK